MSERVGNYFQYKYLWKWQSMSYRVKKGQAIFWNLAQNLFTYFKNHEDFEIPRSVDRNTLEKNRTRAKNAPAKELNTAAYFEFLCSFLFYTLRLVLHLFCHPPNTRCHALIRLTEPSSYPSWRLKSSFRTMRHPYWRKNNNPITRERGVWSIGTVAINWLV